MADTLKPCPFCGSADVETDFVVTPIGKYLNVVCCGCLACGPAHRTEPEAIAAWNQRAVETPHVA